ncbi:vitamin D-binding protein [Heteronotia binoei]|uniref:vitamin D-binding protein n=1 Tax=Heteronotia binoei TaxID=13085 RepID=UPI0029318F3B|nr:vitamin D-binding protein [Heteronotia binoei]XP_060103164.1 vitamin D-binding protein [Heteronotia binoei]
MKTVTLTILLLAVISSHAMKRGRDYMREKVCQEFNNLGKDHFRAGAIISSSKKYSNATYEEILNVVHEIVAIAEKCCPEGADANCYENESLALSAKSCSDSAPFPKHAGIEACCTEKGLERKLCLAALKHPPKEFPTYVEPSNAEVCEAFAKDPQDFRDRYLYEYSTDYSIAPLPVLAASAMSYISMVATCCISAVPRICFLRERLNRRSLAILTHVSNKACSHYDLLGKEKTKLSYVIKFAQKSTNASYEDVIALATDASEVLSRACNPTANVSFERELSEHTAKICSKLSAKDQRFADCCAGECTVKAYFCIYSLPWAKSPHLPDFPQPDDEDLCRENYGNLKPLHYMFEIARRYTYAPEALFTALRDSSRSIVANCCSDDDPKACFALKRPQMTEQLFNLLAKGNELCSEYTHLPFLEFKKKLRETYSEAFPETTEEILSGLVEQRASFASTCCLVNAPPIYCGLKVKSGVSHTCSHNVCLLH